MGLKKTFQNAASLAFKIAADLTYSATYQSVTDDGITPLMEVPYPVSVLPSEFKRDNPLNQENAFFKDIQPGDTIGSVLASELTVEPKKNDRVEATDGRIFFVQDYRIDGAGAVYKLHLRSK